MIGKYSALIYFHMVHNNIYRMRSRIYTSINMMYHVRSRVLNWSHDEALRRHVRWGGLEVRPGGAVSDQ
jgi:hypothetical protein